MEDDYLHNSIFDFLTCFYILHCNEFYVCLTFMLVLSIFRQNSENFLELNLNFLLI